jgi:hypothetical protein
MKNLPWIFIVSLFFFGFTSERPWVGTYTLEIKEENREMFEMFQDLNMVWPEIALHEDGTFLLKKTEGNMVITGTYSVEGSTLTLRATACNDEPPSGIYAKPYIAEFKEKYRVLLMDGPDKEPWILQETEKTGKNESE